MEPIGPKLAEGRDSEIFEHGPGRVLRLARDRRSLVHEAELMRYVRQHGYPCPHVHDAGQGYIVMERLDGPSMLEVAGRPPFPLRRLGRMLGDLHRQLHQIAAPPWLEVAEPAGDRLLHGDLHPLNVMITEQGPAVIDWSNACAGDPSLDVADTWALLACASPPSSGLDRIVIPLGRRVMLRAFLQRVDRDAARRAIPFAVRRRLADRNITEDERQRMRRFADRETASRLVV